MDGWMMRDTQRRGESAREGRREGESEGRTYSERKSVRPLSLTITS